MEIDLANKIEEIEVTTFNKLLVEIEKFQKKTPTSWYRGVRNFDYDLSPSLFRHPTNTQIDEHLNSERVITTRFTQRVMPYLNRRLTDDWDKLFLMQHYGAPTRLLDWTENPLIAAFFALERIEKHDTKDAVVWMCDPIQWNRSAFKHISYKDGVLDETDTRINNHKPGTVTTDMPEFPVMMFGSYNSPRIVAQRGVFSLFGKSILSMNEFYARSDYEPGIIKRIRIPQAKVEELRESLFRKGISETVVFPEIEGLAKELKRENGYA